MAEWNFLPEINVFEAWPKDQQKNISSAKWQERKESLEGLLKALENSPRLVPDTTLYADLVDNLKKIITTDSNVVVVALALKVLQYLAQGLRSKFLPFIHSLLPPMLAKSKEKKANVTTALTSALDSFIVVCDPDKFSSGLVENLEKGNPGSKQILLGFVFRIFVRAQVSKDFVSTLMPSLVKFASDGDSGVRDASLFALGSAKRQLGARCDPFLKSIDAAKLAKIDKGLADATTQREEWLKENAQEHASVASEENPVESSNEADENCAGCTESVSDPWLDLEAVDISSIMAKNFLEMITSTKWQERKEACQTLGSSLENVRLIASTALSEVITALLKVLEKDSNIMTVICAASTLKMTVLALRTDYSTYADKTLKFCFDRCKDKKVKNEIVDLADAVVLVRPCDEFAVLVAEYLKSKSPAIRWRVCELIERLFCKYNSATLPSDAVKEIKEPLEKCCSDADTDVRNASFCAIASVCRCIGEKTGEILFKETFDDKMKAKKILDTLADLREKFGDAVAPEVVRICGAPRKNIPPSKSVTPAPVKGNGKPALTKTVPPVGKVVTSFAPRSRPASATSSGPLGQSSKPNVTSSTSRPTSRASSASGRPNVIASKPPASRPPPVVVRPPTVRTAAPAPVTAVKKFMAKPAPVYNRPAISVPPKSAATRPTAALAPRPVQMKPSSTVSTPSKPLSASAVRKPIAPNVVRQPVASSQGVAANGIPRTASGSRLPAPSALRPPTPK